MQPQASTATPRHPGQEPYSTGESCDVVEWPNPCVPETPTDECNCPKTPGTRERPTKPDRPKGRPDECCEQLIDILSRVPGLELPKPHKPKQRPGRKVQSLCDSIGIADAILPVLAVLWDRHEASEPGRNDFEVKVEAIFANLAKPKHDAMAAGFAGYKAMRKSGKGECLFNDCLADASLEEPIEKTWFAEIMLREGLRFAGQIVFAGSDGVVGPGQARLWDNAVHHGPNGSGATIYQGPWPWLTAICPNVSSYEEYGTTKSFRPAPGASHAWQNYQYAQTCSFTPEPSGAVQTTCERQHPAPPAPGALFGSSCEGGYDYTHNNDCLRIPAQRAGGSIKLKGFNFTTPTVKVRFTLTGSPDLMIEQECTVWGDQETPVKDAMNHSIVDERVRDWVDVAIPSQHPTQPGAPLPAGIYSVTVSVANVTNALYDGGTPAELVTNALLLRIEPDPNVRYLLWSERGHCNRETGGMGDDEIWWDAFAGHLVPNAVPVPPSGGAGVDLKTEHKSFPRPPWEDMDDGESAGGYNRDIFGPAPFELYGVAAIAILGFEVDSEGAARDQIDGKLFVPKSRGPDQK